MELGKIFSSLEVGKKSCFSLIQPISSTLKLVDSHIRQGEAR